MKDHKKGQPFWNRHSRTFGIIGWGVVLLTFVVKDAMRERLKEDSDVIEHTKTTYSALVSTHDVLRGIDSLRPPIIHLVDGVTAIQIPGAKVGYLASWALTVYSAELDEVGEKSDAFGEVMDGLGCNVSDHNEIEHIDEVVSSIENAKRSDFHLVSNEIAGRRLLRELRLSSRARSME